MNQSFTTEQQKALHKIELLLRKAEGNANEHEAAVATQLAQDLLAKYNLDMEAVGNGGGAEAERQDTKIAGGFFDFERDLWRGIAELNWCWYFSTYATGIHKGHDMTRVHRVIGKKVNILSTKLMAEYLLETVNRLAKEYSLERTGKYHNRSALVTSFRKGAVERLVGKLQERRWKVMEEERAREQEARAQGDASGKALAVTRLSQAEYERNYDFLYGKGAYAEAMARNAQREKERKEREEREAKWRLENPKEAEKLDREAEKRAKREQEKWERRQRRQRYKAPASDMSAYNSGYDQARDIGLDPQIKKEERKKGLIGGGE